MNFAHDGGICQNSLLLKMEDSRLGSLIFLGVSLCGLVIIYSLSLYGRIERSIEGAISSDEHNHNHVWTEAVTL